MIPPLPERLYLLQEQLFQPFHFPVGIERRSIFRLHNFREYFEDKAFCSHAVPILLQCLVAVSAKPKFRLMPIPDFVKISAAFNEDLAIDDISDLKHPDTGLHVLVFVDDFFPCHGLLEFQFEFGKHCPQAFGSLSYLHRMRRCLVIGLFLLSKLVLAQLPKPSEFNTASGGEAIGSIDQHWKVATDLNGPFVPATVVGNCDAQWFNSPASNANWVSLDDGNGCYHSGDDFNQFYQRAVMLPATNRCGLPIGEVFCFVMDFYADNCIREVLVNGIINYENTGSDLDCDNLQHRVTVPLCDGWQAGLNTLTIHVRSTPPAIGFLAVAKTTPHLSDDFLGQDTFLCSAIKYEITSPDSLTRWFDGSTGFSVTAEKSGAYWAVRQDAEGCEIRDTVNVAFPANFYIPNAFSPNGDGLNDEFAPAPGGIPPPFYHLQVFDRWGGLVFEGHDPSIGWNGERNGKPCSTGIYTYLIATGTATCTQIQGGDLLLLR